MNSVKKQVNNKFLTRLDDSIGIRVGGIYLSQTELREKLEALQEYEKMIETELATLAEGSLIKD